jgi:hypothetical protein
MGLRALRGQMKRSLAATLLVAASILPASAQVYSDIDVDLPAFPEMQPIGDSPVYWAPNVDSNYFFYDGVFWDYHHDLWHWSAWYNGPWAVVDPIYVPTYVLWVPIRYYRRPPHYFHAWNPSRPPHWGEHWGRDWQNRHNAIYGARTTPVTRAPLPVYQQQYTRANYPRGQSQYAIHGQQYGYQPRENVVRQHYENRGVIQQPQPQPQPPAQPQDALRRERR